MGEEAMQEEPKAEEKKEENAEEKKEEPPKPSPSPSPLVLYLDLHCEGCAKKIQRSLMRIRGVEGVVIDMAENQVTMQGVVDPQAVCAKIMKKTKRTAKVLSPLPQAEEPIPELTTSQVSSPITVELNVNMHCEACAKQLKNKILKMKEVQTATTDFSTGKVTVTGTMDAKKLVDYVYKRTKKTAKIVPQPELEPEEKKEEEKPAAEEAKPENVAEEKKEEKAEEAKKEEGDHDNNQEIIKEENKEEVTISPGEEDQMKKMMYYYQPLYVIERIPPPQIFSDENPNACCIS